MGFKIINSREYREVCERVAFLESDIEEKNRELEVKDETIKRLKKEIVQIQGYLEEVKNDLKSTQAGYNDLLKEFEQLKSAKPERIDFVPDEAPAAKSEAKKPRPASKPSPRKGDK